MSDLVAFVNARIAEVEQDAEDFLGRGRSQASTGARMVAAVLTGFQIPDWCAAMRTITARYSTALAAYDWHHGHNDDGPEDPGIDANEADILERHLRWIVRAIAGIWADHPDYNHQWTNPTDPPPDTPTTDAPPN
ncbi:DUF6221 family protein [Nakamurella endophytica]|uniref:Uncharacterized protein n=1 Tax=Nakamurella endophytica TaxID=1748367 RepID=A0A917T386_9ACTN|nr:DUF6221 family protein [Nakamurella endophytica]GGM09311.1 hypothetical protein GCM10011594_31510 [Nakamurella endophytica]